MPFPGYHHLQLTLGNDPPRSTDIQVFGMCPGDGSSQLLVELVFPVINITRHDVCLHLREHNAHNICGPVTMVISTRMLAVRWLKEVVGRHFNLYLMGLVLLIPLVGVAASICSKPGNEDG